MVKLFDWWLHSFIGTKNQVRIGVQQRVLSVSTRSEADIVAIATTRGLATTTLQIKGKYSCTVSPIVRWNSGLKGRSSSRAVASHLNSGSATMVSYILICFSCVWDRNQFSSRKFKRDIKQIPTFRAPFQYFRAQRIRDSMDASARPCFCGTNGLCKADRWKYIPWDAGIMYWNELGVYVGLNKSLCSKRKYLKSWPRRFRIEEGSLLNMIQIITVVPLIKLLLVYYYHSSLASVNLPELRE